MEVDSIYYLCSGSVHSAQSSPRPGLVCDVGHPPPHQQFKPGEEVTLRTDLIFSIFIE